MTNSFDVYDLEMAIVIIFKQVEKEYAFYCSNDVNKIRVLYFRDLLNKVLWYPNLVSGIRCTSWKGRRPGVIPGADPCHGEQLKSHWIAVEIVVGGRGSSFLLTSRTLQVWSVTCVNHQRPTDHSNSRENCRQDGRLVVLCARLYSTLLHNNAASSGRKKGRLSRCEENQYILITPRSCRKINRLR